MTDIMKRELNMNEARDILTEKKALEESDVSENKN